RIRTGDKETPVNLLTAKDSVEDKVSGLDLGANDYITKPFQIEEFLARVRVALRMNAQKSDPADEVDWLQIADLRLNEMTHEVFRGDTLIELTPREFDLLAYLMKNATHVLNRDQLLNDVWGYDYYGDTNVVD